MLILPAIDLRQGRCVRLLQGREQDETVYDHDPAAVAERFVAAGAQRLHLVDLDGAFRGQGANLASIQEVVRRTRIPVQVGGRLRTREDVRRMLDLGVASVIIGTMAVKHPQELEKARASWDSGMPGTPWNSPSATTRNPPTNWCSSTSQRPRKTGA